MTVTLNQFSSFRPIEDLFPYGRKTVEGLAAEITEYVNQLQGSDFLMQEGLPAIHHVVTADIRVRLEHT